MCFITLRSLPPLLFFWPFFNLIVMNWVRACKEEEVLSSPSRGLGILCALVLLPSTYKGLSTALVRGQRCCHQSWKVLNRAPSFYCGCLWLWRPTEGPYSHTLCFFLAFKYYYKQGQGRGLRSNRVYSVVIHYFTSNFHVKSCTSAWPVWTDQWSLADQISSHQLLYR